MKLVPPAISYEAQVNSSNTKYNKTRSDASWVFTDGKEVKSIPQKIFGKGMIAKYKICLCNHCPESSDATFFIKGTGFYFLHGQNGNLFGQGHIWQQFANITVKGLKCGCNNVFFLYLYNYYPSHLGIYYYVIQPRQEKCWSCLNPGINTYNPQTCRCECTNGNNCVGGQYWDDYPNCRCRCRSEPLTCSLRSQYFDYRLCTCTCVRRCCPWESQDPTTCACIKKAVASLSEERDCIQGACHHPFVWSQ